MTEKNSFEYIVPPPSRGVRTKKIPEVCNNECCLLRVACVDGRVGVAQTI